MRAPQLNRKLVLEAPLRVPDGAGGFSESWGALGVLWASVRAGTGREAEAAGLSISTVPYKITVRAAPGGGCVAARGGPADARWRAAVPRSGGDRDG